MNTPWISANERLPDDESVAFKKKFGKQFNLEVNVIISGARIGTTLEYDYKEKTFKNSDGEEYPVTHWCSIPEPPEVT